MGSLIYDSIVVFPFQFLSELICKCFFFGLNEDPCGKSTRGAR